MSASSRHAGLHRRGEHQRLTRQRHGAIRLIDDEARQHIHITCHVTLDTNCENAGVVFGCVDNQNYWVVAFSKAAQTRKRYQVAAGTWTEKASGAQTITSGVQFETIVQARDGGKGFPRGWGRDENLVSAVTALTIERCYARAGIAARPRGASDHDVVLGMPGSRRSAL